MVATQQVSNVTTYLHLSPIQFWSPVKSHYFSN